MDWDKMKLPSLEEVLGRVEEEVGNNEISISRTSRVPRFYDSTCVIKEEEDGRGKIQIENIKNYPVIVCRYCTIGGSCKVKDLDNCAHHWT